MLAKNTSFTVYTSRQNNDIQDYIESIQVKKLNEREKEQCDKIISIEELDNIVKNSKVNKAPGLDGLTSEYYKTFWPQIRHLVYNMIIESFEEGEMPDSMKKAVVTLIHKKGNKNRISNYRPISLTNYDYKLIAFVLAERLQSVISDIVDQDQTGFIKKRFIGHNIRLVQDIIEYTSKHNVPGALISLDFHKAYDSLEWNFMLEALKHFNFGDNFIKWIRILYTHPSMVFKNKGWISSPIYPSRGIRQGCPVSSLIFILSTEIMASSLRQNDKVNGIKAGPHEYKLSQYADDSYLFMQDVESIQNALSDIERFSSVAGLKLNLEKTEGIWLGNYKDHPPDFNAIAFTKEPLKCLGIFVGHDRAKCKEYNWVPKLEKLQNMLYAWKNRELTLFGKALVIKVLGIAKLMFNFMMLEVDELKVKEINKILYDFLWNKRERIQRKTLIGEVEKGGIGMVDIESKIQAAKAAWVKHIVSENKWNGILQHEIEKLGFTVDLLLKCNFTSIKEFPCINKIPRFYQEVFICLNKCKSNGTKNESDMFKEIIWGNNMFKTNNMCLYEKTWLKSGIIYVKDLIVSDHFVKPPELLDKLECKSNWIAEYSKVKRVMQRALKDLNLSKVKYINIKDNKGVLYINKRFIHIKDVTTKELYNIFVSKKLERPKMEHVWCKEFDIDKFQTTWNNIYNRKIRNMAMPKMQEFNYKVLNNILVSGKFVNKWNKNVSEKCDVCNLDNTVKHMLYECERVKVIWSVFSNVCKCEIKWKHIVIGHSGSNINGQALNIMITFVAYIIYAQWIKCINSTSKEFKDLNLLKCCEYELLHYMNCLEYTKYKNVASTVKTWLQKL